MSSKVDALRSPLQFQLDQITAHTRSLVQPERLARAEQIIAELDHAGVADRILGVPDEAPPFRLNGATGKKVASADLLALGSVIVKFFRGRWDPYDVTELERWEELQPEVRSQKSLFVAISPQTVRQNDFMVQQHRFTFPILSDPGCVVGTAFRVAHTVPKETQTYYRSLLVNIPFLNGDESWRLPLPATFFVDSTSTIRYARAFADHRRRPEPDEVLAHLRS